MANKRISDLPADTAPLTTDVVPVDGASTRKVALSDFFGVINKVGTVTTGVWNASAVAVAYGGTGATTAAAARTNLGLAIGTDVQAFDAELAALAALTSAADRLPYFTGSGTASLATFTAFARTLVDDPDAATARTTLGVAIGTNVQAWDTDLDAIAALTGTGILRRTGAGTASAGTAVANSELAAMAAYTFKGNNSGSTAAPGDIDIAALPTKASPAAGDYLWISDQAASGAWKKAPVSAVASAGSVASLNGQTGALVLPTLPQGRLTLTTGVAIMQTSQAAQGTVYYTPFAGNTCPIYDGTNLIPTVFTERSQALTDTTKSPAAATTNSNYDLFVWNDSGTIRCTRGPAWTSSTARGTGAGTSELAYVNSIALNANAITNGPAAQRGTYVGTIRTNGSSTVDFVFGSVGAGGGAANFGLWNAYNRTFVKTLVGSTSASWTYTVANTWRTPNSEAWTVSFIRGLDIDPIEAGYKTCGIPSASSNVEIGIGLNSTTAQTGVTAFVNNNSTTFFPMEAKYEGVPGLGYGYVAALEQQPTTATSTYLGGSRSGLFVELML